MKKIIVLAMSLFLVVATSSCKKEETTDTEDTTTPALNDAATAVAGTYTGSGGGLVPGSTTPFTCTQIKVTRVSASSVTITSPENLFSSITMSGLTKDSDGSVTNNGTTSSIVYVAATNSIDVVNATASGTLTFSGTK